MKRCITIAAVVVAVVAFSGTRAVPASGANPTCPAKLAGDMQGMTWMPPRSDLSGVRAPIEMKTDGLVCSGGTYYGFAASWIGIESGGFNSITQVGVYHFYNNGTGTGEFCRFWAIDGGAPHTYGCNQQVNDQLVYFEIFRFTDPSTHMLLYDILDCGTAGGYGSCTGKDSSQVAYSTAFGIASAETDYGQDACTVQIMGSSTAAQRFGTSAYPIEGTLGDSSWQTRSFAPGSGPICQDYPGTFKPERQWIWDTRN